jgi:hypothetical protein
MLLLRPTPQQGKRDISKSLSFFQVPEKKRTDEDSTWRLVTEKIE